MGGPVSQCGRLHNGLDCMVCVLHYCVDPDDADKGSAYLAAAVGQVVAGRDACCQACCQGGGGDGPGEHVVCAHRGHADCFVEVDIWILGLAVVQALVQAWDPDR